MDFCVQFSMYCFVHLFFDKWVLILLYFFVEWVSECHADIYVDIYLAKFSYQNYTLTFRKLPMIFYTYKLGSTIYG